LRAVALNQADPRWANQTLGDSSRTFKQSGCLLVCLTMLANRILDGESEFYLPPDVHRKLVDAKAFWRSTALINVHKAAKALKMRWVEVGPFDPKRAHAHRRAGNAGCILGIDYKDGASSASSPADHFVVLHQVKDDAITVLDPDGGRMFMFDGLYKGRPARITEMRLFDTEEEWRAHL